jgi:hypothetical protein
VTLRSKYERLVWLIKEIGNFDLSLAFVSHTAGPDLGLYRDVPQSAR